MTEATTYHKNLKLMGNHFQISAVAEDEESAYAYIDARHTWKFNGSKNY